MRRGHDDSDEIVDSMRAIQFTVIATGAVAASATDLEFRIRASRLQGLRHLRAAARRSQKKSAPDRFYELSRRASAIRVSVDTRLRSRVTVAGLIR